MNSRSQNLLNKFFIWGLLILCPSVFAADHNALINQVKQELEQQWQALSQHEAEELVIRLTGLPAGYQPPACNGGYSLQLNQDLKPGRNAVQVTCPGREAWQLNMTADLQVWRQVVVNHAPLLNKGQITASQLRLKKRNIAQLHRGYFTELEQVAGSISRRSLKPGTTITPSMIELPVLVKRGQSIKLRVSNPAVTVEMAGEALRKGRAGELIKVRNISSGKILHGRVISSELVQIQ